MNNHKNARLTVHGRALLVNRVVEQGIRPAEAAKASGVSLRTAYKWLARYREEGFAGLINRSSRPANCPHAVTPKDQAKIVALRKARHSCHRICRETGISASTISRLLRRNGLGRLASLEPAPPLVRYEYEQPGDLLHLDIKKLGRFERPGHRVTGNQRRNSRRAGWEFLHVAIDDHSRLGFSCVRRRQDGIDACKALLEALRYYQSLNIRFTRVMTDNGSCYISRKFQRLCQRLKLKHLRTKPYTPRTNGKAERFIQTSLREWAYSRSYDSSLHRAAHLRAWLHDYNWHRPHASLNYLPPISRAKSVNNLVALHN